MSAPSRLVTAWRDIREEAERITESRSKKGAGGAPIGREKGSHPAEGAGGRESESGARTARNPE